MPNLINTDTKLIIRDACDDIITTVGKNCKLLYPVTRFEACSCADTVGTKPDSAWRTGGHLPLPNMSCPLCGGTNKRAVESSDIVKFVLNWDIKRGKDVGPDVRSPYSLVEIKGYQTDLPKLMKADFLIIQVPDNLIHQRFKRISEPTDPYQLVPGRYFVCMFERI